MRLAILSAFVLLGCISQSGYKSPDPTWYKTYGELRSQVRESNGIGVIIVSAEWCKPCKKLKDLASGLRWDTTVSPEIRSLPWAVVDIDKQPKTAKLLRGNTRSVPVIVVIKHDPAKGWKGVKMVGLPSRERLLEFLGKAVKDGKEHTKK